jgi:hypothetical protein
MNPVPHAHDHDHTHDSDTYFLDQICMVGVSGAFGAICLSLYIGNAMAGEGSQTMLSRLLGPQFHLFVLASGVALVVVALARGFTLWRQVGRPGHVNAHHHDHDHDHEHHHEHDHEHHHEHGECGHEHGVCAHEHAHTHSHHHSHDHGHHHHDHDAADHDHGWAPWRYVLLLVPIILFLLGLPNKGPAARPIEVKHLDMTHEAAGYAGMLTSIPDSPAHLVSWLAALYVNDETDAQEVSYKDLEGYAALPDKQRDEKRGKTFRVRGQYAPSPANDHIFTLVRFRIQCCAADAIPMQVPIVTREKLSSRSDLTVNEWVKVTGVLDFQKAGNKTFTLLRVNNLRSIERCAPDSNPYIQ